MLFVQVEQQVYNIINFALGGILYEFISPFSLFSAMIRLDFKKEKTQA